MTIEPIATVRSCFGGKFAVPRQPGLCPSAWGRLVLHPPYRSREALRGIEGFSHLWLIFGFHQTAEQGWRPTVRPPRLGGDLRVGVFATRSTFRPNGLGLSLVKLDGIRDQGEDAPQLLLGGIDLVDGTPVYDIKPYLPYVEALPEASDGFAGEEIPRLSVNLLPEAAKAMGELPPRSQAVLREALSLDPRPAVRRGEEDRVFGAALCGCEVRFSIQGNCCSIHSIQPAEGSGLNA